jgi:uncharacterized protein (TIGR03663 family)
MAIGRGDEDRDGDGYLLSIDALDRVPWLGDRDDLTRGVALIVLAGLVLRLVALGARVAHFDEGRVAYFTEYFVRTGNFEYRPIIHGPFLQHVNSWLFSVLGPTDFSMRLIVALVGAALPLTALLLRDRLRRTEVLALAFFLALNPVLLYYSRFSRSSVLVAAFMFGAFALFVRLLDTGDVRLLYAGTFLAALGFASKENAVLYVLCWLGAGALVADRALFGPADYDGGVDRLSALGDRIGTRIDGERLGRYLGHLALGLALFLLVLLFLYAPRGTGSPVEVAGRHVGLWGMFTAPGAIPDVLAATVSDFGKIGYWISQPGNEGGESVRVAELTSRYTRFFGGTLETYALYAAPLVAFGLIGFLLERYGASRPRPFVMFAAYWAFASALGYPLGTDIYGAWIVVNVLVPLAIPAAVGMAKLYRVGVESLAAEDGASVGLVALIFLLVFGQMAVAAANGVYLDDDSADAMVQYAQPSDEMRVATEAMRAAASDGSEPDVLFYGEYFVDDEDDFVGLGDDDIRVPLHPQCTKFFPSLSLPWYTYKDDVAVTCAVNESALAGVETVPPVVIARSSAEPVLDERLGSGYEKTRFLLRTDEGDTTESVVYVRR